jgi:hypothetical protein
MTDGRVLFSDRDKGPTCGKLIGLFSESWYHQVNVPSFQMY